MKDMYEDRIIEVHYDEVGDVLIVDWHLVDSFDYIHAEYAENQKELFEIKQIVHDHEPKYLAINMKACQTDDFNQKKNCMLFIKSIFASYINMESKKIAFVLPRKVFLNMSTEMSRWPTLYKDSKHEVRFFPDMIRALTWFEVEAKETI